MSWWWRYISGCCCDSPALLRWYRPGTSDLGFVSACWFLVPVCLSLLRSDSISGSGFWPRTSEFVMSTSLVEEVGNVWTVNYSRVSASPPGSSPPTPPVSLRWYSVLSVPVMDEKTAVSLLPRTPPPFKWWCRSQMRLNHFDDEAVSNSWCYPCFDVCCVMLH